MSLISFSQREISYGRTNDSNQHKLLQKDIKHFDWNKRWLKGDQYAYILNNIDLYCTQYGFQKFEPKCHPDSIYKNPINGLIYFVKGKDVGSEFGFPRVNGKKKYRWKKMNFKTELPKRNPFVTYVVASSMISINQQVNKELPNFRMHAVIPYSGIEVKQNPIQEYILCHVREVQHKNFEIEEEIGLETCFRENMPDFYRLFLYLHNMKTQN